MKPTVRGLYNMANKYATYGQADIFTAIDIETNAKCNMVCSYCPVSLDGKGRGDHYMPESLFRKIVDDVSEFPFRGRLSPHFYGEPTLDERLPSLMAYARKKLPLASLIIHTNGTRLTRTLYRELLKAGVIGFVITRHAPKWPKNVLDILEHEPGAKQYIKLQDLENYALFNRGGTVAPEKERKFNRCFYLSDEVGVTYTGEVVCTNDYYVKESFGNVTKQHLLHDIWWGEEFSTIRRRLRQGKFDLGLCQACSGNIPKQA